MGKVFWTDERIEHLKVLVEEGKSYEELAEAFGKKKGTIRRVLYLLRKDRYPDLYVKVRNPHYWAEEEDRVLIECVCQGKSVTDAVRAVRRVRNSKRAPDTIFRRMTTLRVKDPTLPYFEIHRHHPSPEEHKHLKEILGLPAPVTYEQIKSIQNQYNDWAIEQGYPYRQVGTMKSWCDQINANSRITCQDISIQDVALALGCHEATVQRWCKKDWLKFKKKGLIYYTNRKDLKKLFRDRPYLLKDSLKPKGDFMFLASLLGWL